MNENEEITIGKSLVPWLGKTKHLIDNSIEDILADNNIDLSKAQFVILKNIDKNDGLSQKELTFFSNRNKSTLTRMLATLERKKYIVKQHCKNDKRQFNVNITSLGKKIITESEPVFTEFVKKMEYGISDDERSQLISLLNKIQNNIIGEGPSPFFKEKL